MDLQATTDEKDYLFIIIREDSVMLIIVLGYIFICCYMLFHH